MLSDVEVLRVVEVLVGSTLNRVDDSRLQVDEERARNIVLVVSLVEKDVLAVVALHGVLLQDALRTDAVLLAQAFPELVSNYSS